MEVQQPLLDEQMGGQDDVQQAWLEEHGLVDLPRVAGKLQIEDGWEFALEQIIGRFSQGLLLPNIDALSRALQEAPKGLAIMQARSEEHTSELQSRPHLVCRLLLEKKHLGGR